MRESQAPVRSTRTRAEPSMRMIAETLTLSRAPLPFLFGPARLHHRLCFPNLSLFGSVGLI